MLINNREKNIIIIPVYKDKIDKHEEISFRQCCRILGKHRICLVTYTNCDCGMYCKIALQHSVTLWRENFPEDYFDSIDGYNKLMLSHEFYLRFKRYEYMLIYQLDAYVFRDELDSWCKKEYDYIGAPWFTGYKSISEGGKLWLVGNGGLSLRRISTMIRLFSKMHPTLSFKKIMRRKQRVSDNIFRNIITSFVRSIGYKNNIEYYKKLYVGNEDTFICQYLTSLGVDLKIATSEVAMYFSFEQNPSYLYSLTNNKLPFACHAWFKYEYNDFWNIYIK